jgi:hypothetical protein
MIGLKYPQTRSLMSICLGHDYGAGTLVRSLRGLKGEKSKMGGFLRAGEPEGAEGPSPGPVFGGNGRALVGSKGPYLLPGEILIPGFNRPVQSNTQADSSGCQTVSRV